MTPVPIVLFAYARPRHLTRALDCLRRNGVPMIYAYSDGPKGSEDAAAVHEVRNILRKIDWCKTRLVERAANIGLGLNILSGVDEVAARHEAFIAWEDDLICVDSTYAWLCAALQAYADDKRVMSATAWTHPRVTPSNADSMPYFDGRAESWTWGSWSRSWCGMLEETARQKMLSAERDGLPRGAYGADMPQMVREEQSKNLWAVRWLYHHLQHGGLCVRPPWSMVEHIGFDAAAANANTAVGWNNPPLSAAPPIPTVWPEPREHPECRKLWHTAYPSRQERIWRRLKFFLRRRSSLI